MAERARRVADNGRELLTTERWVMIRRSRDDGHEWLDLSTASGLPGDVKRAVADGNLRAGTSWANANPTVRIVKVTIAEVERV